MCVWWSGMIAALHAENQKARIQKMPFQSCLSKAAHTIWAAAVFTNLS
jgi:hypothetical protein